MSTQDKIPTWEDFPAFYENPIIKSIADKEKWTVSTTKIPEGVENHQKTKMPIDMVAFMTESKIWGAKYDRGYNPLVDLKTLCQVIPSATNNAYYLDALTDGIVVLDIEPKCPSEIKTQFLKLPYLYAETSLSGYGLHLIFYLPKIILDKYPEARNKLSLKEENGYYEILLNHMVTFTRNALPPSKCEASIDDFEGVFESLASKAKPSQSAEHVVIDEIDIESIPYYDELMDKILPQKYAKTLQDFPQKGNKTGFDNSGYEFGMSNFYYRALQRLLIDGHYKDHTFTDEEKAIIVYQCVSQNIAYRPKHDETRENMPWLLYVATCLIARS